MRIGNIFALFGFSEENEEDKITRKKIEDFKETPFFKIGMFTKMILNGTNFKKQIVGFFSKSDKDLDVLGIGEAGDFMMFNRAWYWISECNTKRKDWKEALQNSANSDFLVCLKLSIKYFENIEEFEKCAFLIKIQKFIEKEILKVSLKET